MRKWRRTAEISKGLVTILVLFALAAGIFWIIKCRGAAEDIKGAQLDEPAEWKLWCPECKESFTFATREEANALPREGRKIQCPKCKEFVATWDPPERTTSTGEREVRP